MARVSTQRSAVIPARPEALYAIVSDYRNGHPHILPRPYFGELIVEKGGIGAGTVMRFPVRMLGVTRHFHQIVSEPEPGRVIEEKNLDETLTTTFTFTPRAGGQECEVTIRTEWTVRPGVAGWIEQALTKPMMRKLFAKELKQLAGYVQQQSAAVHS
jgi:ribosome-associated toxin RatA of RatAB toxin-antitoxin module